MALTPSNMLELETVAPEFELLDTISDKKLKLENLKGAKATVIMFICNHCPFVIHLDGALVKFANDYLEQGVSVIAISSNDVAKYKADSPDKMKKKAENLGYRFPYLYDEAQEVAKAYDAACTPDFYVFDKDMKLAYRGQFDDSRPGNFTAATGKDIRAALDAVITGSKVNANQKPSMGCNIKWK